MQKRIYLVLCIFILSLVIGSFAVFAQRSLANDVTYNSHWDNTCDRNGNCVLNVYSYEKYFYDELQDSWVEIDEDWEDCSTENETRFCTNEYHFRVVADESGFVTSHLGENNLRTKLSKFRGSDLNFEPSVDGSILIYEDVIPEYVDIRYQYLPKKLKEEIVIKQPLPVAITEDFDLVFDTSGDAGFDIAPSIICDATTYCETINTIVGVDRVRVRVPVSFFLRDELEYPVIIDPTIELGGSDSWWNGYVEENEIAEPFTYPRTDNPTSIQVGNSKVHGDGRGGIDWHTQNLPDTGLIEQVNLTIHIEEVNGSSTEMEVHEVAPGGSFFYPDVDDDCESGGGNCHFYTDMGNGTLYDSRNYSGDHINVTMDLGSVAVSNLQDALTSGDNFSIGFKANNLSNLIMISPRDDRDAEQRPKLTVSYTLTAPNISFVSPTPSNGSTVFGNSIFVNVSSSSLGVEHYTLVDFDNDLVLWMRMDEVNKSGDPTDLSSYGNNGSIKGDVVINSALGYWGNGSYYDGTGDYVEIPDDTSLDFDTESFTASLWIKFPNSTSSQRFFLAKKSGTSAGNPGWVIYHQSDGDLTLMLADGTTRLWTRDNVGDSIDDGEWHHVVFVVDGRDGIREYVDGVSQSPTLNEGPLSSISSINNSQVMRIGARSDGGTMFNGYIDDVLIFKRNLSATEVSALYNAATTQYERNFTSLADGTHTFTGYAVDVESAISQTEERTLNSLSVANETEGDEAIEIGINNSIPGNAIETDQQIYVVDENGEHFLGAFDKTTVSGNQTWAFNYVTGGENFTNMSSLFSTLNIWEDEYLSFDDIASQVEGFINQTMW